MSRAKKKNINNPAERRAGWVFGRGKVAQMGEIKGGVLRPFVISLLSSLIVLTFIIFF